MKIYLQTQVPGEFKKVFYSFNKELFEFLLPPGAKLLQFDGSKKGDIVHLKFDFPVLSEWISEIVEEKSTDDELQFVDVGRKLPLGIKEWRHKHIVRKNGENSMIVDDIVFSTGFKLLDLIYYPVLYLSFLPRKGQYRRYFRQKFSRQ